MHILKTNERRGKGLHGHQVCHFQRHFTAICIVLVVLFDSKLLKVIHATGDFAAKPLASFAASVLAAMSSSSGVCRGVLWKKENGTKFEFFKLTTLIFKNIRLSSRKEHVDFISYGFLCTAFKVMILQMEPGIILAHKERLGFCLREKLMSSGSFCLVITGIV